MNYRKILKWTMAAALLLCVAVPDIDARRRRSNNATPAEAQAEQQQAEPARKKSNQSQGTSVTKATQDAASKASGNRPGQAQKGSGGGALTKIKVDRPDLNKIMEATLDPSNKFYYPKLWEKYSRNDTTMTPEEYRYLYLGYMFQEDYDPYRESPYTAVTEDLRDKASHTRAEIDTIRKYAEKALQDNPFDLRQMSFLVHVLKERNKNMSAKIWEYRLEHLLGAIKSTGTGEDVENAWFVIYPVHEYDMVQLLGYEAVDVEYVEPGYDHLMVQPDGTVKHRNPAKGFYFNVLVPQQQYELKHPDEEG